MTPISFIRDFIETHGGRLAGSPQEANAQADLAHQLRQFCKTVHIQPFYFSSHAKFSSLKLFCLVFYITLALSFFGFKHLGILIAAWLNTVLFLGHFVMYKDWLNPFFPKKLSFNVIGVLEPEQTVKKTIILSGHMDNVREFWWWYKFKTWGAKLTLISGLVLALWPLFLTLDYFFDLPTIKWIFLCLSPTTLSMFFMHGNKVVDGAQDNLSGIATALFTLKRFVHPEKNGYSTLQHTRLKIVSFGAEECGTCGSKAYAHHFQEELIQENACIINLDGIKDPEHFTIFEREINPMVRYPKAWVDSIADCFQEKGIACKRVPLWMGGTDGHRFHKKKITALTITAQVTHRLDPTYHTRLDTWQNLNPLAMNHAIDILTHFILKQDKNN